MSLGKKSCFATMQVDSLNVFDHETQPGLPEAPATPAISEEDLQMEAMGWKVPKTCRPSLPATAAHGGAPAVPVPRPATVPHEGHGASPATPSGIPAPATVPQQVIGGLPATVLQQVGAPAPTTVPQHIGGVPATALPTPTMPQQHGSGQTGGVPATALPTPATVIQQDGHGQTGGVPATALPTPAAVIQQGGSGQNGMPASLPQQMGLPAPATAVTQQAPATAVPKHGLHAPATGGLAAPATPLHEAQAKACPKVPAVPHVPHVPSAPAVPKHEMMPPPRFVPQQSQIGSAAPPTHACKSGMPANKDEYSRRAAANLIKRLKENPSRVEGMPSLKTMLYDGERKSELISLLVDNQGNLANVQAFLQVQEEVGRVKIARKKALRYTKKQMQDTYGEDAENVMKFKEAQGLIEDDENNPNGKVYLISAQEDETENYQRNCSLDACLMKNMVQT